MLAPWYPLTRKKCISCNATSNKDISWQNFSVFLTAGGFKRRGKIGFVQTFSSKLFCQYCMRNQAPLWKIMVCLVRKIVHWLTTCTLALGWRCSQNIWRCAVSQSLPWLFLCAVGRDASPEVIVDAVLREYGPRVHRALRGGPYAERQYQCHIADTVMPYSLPADVETSKWVPSMLHGLCCVVLCWGISCPEWQDTHTSLDVACSLRFFS